MAKFLATRGQERAMRAVSGTGERAARPKHKMLSCPSEDGKSLWWGTDASMRRHAHHIDRRVAHRQLADVARLAFSEDFRSEKEFHSFIAQQPVCNRPVVLDRTPPRVVLSVTTASVRRQTTDDLVRGEMVRRGSVAFSSLSHRIHPYASHEAQYYRRRN